ncbi:DUF4139 domain-containing protein [Phenylobacterium sp.]|uniref:DUF4139 domain-containing protein n=1 Tax=Phenylobacterium sp. TaxID=1871053 RepID=UPI0035B0ED2D
MPGRAAIALAVALAAPAGAQVVSEAPDRAAVTIYRQGEPDYFTPAYEVELDPWSGLAFVSETRTVELPAGPSRISFRGVAETMVAETAAVEGLPGAVIERNQDYDLLSPGALLEAAVGETVSLVRTNPATGEVTTRRAVLRSGPDGPVLETDGGIEALRCSGLPERIVFDRTPEGLTERPTFSVLAETPKAGLYTVRLSYLATGFNWSADYVARLSPDGRTVDLSGWLTLVNNTATSFVRAPTDVVAGELSRDEATVPTMADAEPVATHCWGGVGFPAIPPLPVPPVARRVAEPDLTGLEEIVVTGSRIARQSDLGDYKLYTLPEPTTVAARQTKQVLFLDQKAVPVERVYAFRVDDDTDLDDADPGPTRVVLRLRNEVRRGLGKPLPSGVVAVMAPSDRGAVLAGEDRVKDTPVGLPLDLEIGRSADVQAQVRVLRDWEADGLDHAELEVTFSNARAASVVVEHRQAPLGDDFKVRRASQRAGTRNGDAFWSLRVPAGGHARLTYEISVRR